LPEPGAVSLAPMNRARIDATWRWLQQPRLRRLIDTGRSPDRAGNRRYWQARARDRARRDFAVVTRSGRHVGNCGLLDIDRRRGEAQLWIYLGVARGQGCGSGAMTALLAHAFGDLGLRRVYLRVGVDNPRARRFYRGLGFSPWHPAPRVRARYRGRRSSRWLARTAT
jgi:RimJ/RimL family protein N-acetyltransferase